MNATAPPKIDSNCYHCALPVPSGAPFSCELQGKQRNFCCPACMAVASTIVGAGLGNFYRYQTASEQRPADKLLQKDFSAFDDETFQANYVTVQEQQGEILASTQLLISGIHCTACTWLLEHHLKTLPGLKRVAMNFSEQKASISWDPSQLKLSDICAAIASIGYGPEPYQQEQLIALQRQESRQALRRLGVAGIGMMQVVMFAIALYAGDMQDIATQYRDFMRWTSWLVATVVMLYSARIFFIGAWRGLKMRKPGMDLPVAIAIGLAYIASGKATLLGTGEVYFDSVTMFTFFLLGGRYLEMRARHYSGRLSRDLHSLLPSTALRIESDEANAQHQVSIPLINVKVGDQLFIKPGEVVPADGRIISGQSALNESQLNGEFAPQKKELGDSVTAGTINISSPIIIHVERTGADLHIQTISDLLDHAQANKPNIALLADRLSRYFISAVLLLALSTYVLWLQWDADQAFWIMLSVLVVSCPCALSLATPAALTAATQRLRRSGLLVASSQVWEKIPTIDHVVCDKTGTLTQGKLSVSAVHSENGFTQQQCLEWAAMLENGSEHPIAHAFQTFHKQLATAITITVGEGVEGVIDGKRYRIGRAAFCAALYNPSHQEQPVAPHPQHSTLSGQWIMLANEAGPCAWFQLQDVLRDDAPQLIQHLHDQGMTVHMLSGDSSGSAEQLSHALNIDHCIAGATPQQKLDYIAALQQQGATVLMLGDGINDIPVLAAADVSLAMINASDLAKTHADGILLTKHLHSVIELMSLSRATRRNIKQNLGWSLVYNFSAIPLAAQGLIPPYLAAIGMSLSSLLVLLNALRLQRWQLTSVEVQHDTSLPHHGEAS